MNARRNIMPAIAEIPICEKCNYFFCEKQNRINLLLDTSKKSQLPFELGQPIDSGKKRQSDQIFMSEKKRINCFDLEYRLSFSNLETSLDNKLTICPELVSISAFFPSFKAFL